MYQQNQATNLIKIVVFITVFATFVGIVIGVDFPEAIQTFFQSRSEAYENSIQIEQQASEWEMEMPLKEAERAAKSEYDVTILEAQAEADALALVTAAEIEAARRLAEAEADKALFTARTEAEIIASTAQMEQKTRMAGMKAQALFFLQLVGGVLGSILLFIGGWRAVERYLAVEQAERQVETRPGIVILTFPTIHAQPLVHRTLAVQEHPLYLDNGQVVLDDDALNWLDVVAEEIYRDEHYAN